MKSFVTHKLALFKNKLRKNISFGSFEYFNRVKISANYLFCLIMCGIFKSKQPFPLLLPNFHQLHFFWGGEGTWITWMLFSLYPLHCLATLDTLDHYLFKLLPWILLPLRFSVFLFFFSSFLFFSLMFL